MSGRSDVQSDDERSIKSMDDDDRRSGSDNEGRRRSGADSGDEDKDKKVKKTTKPKKKGPVKRMMLSEDELTGKNGLLKLQEMFQNFKFHGKGHEKQDLDLLLHKYEQWTHVMFAKTPFSQMLERIEFLGSKKKVVKVHLKKIRMGMLSNDNEEFVTEEMEEKHASDNENPPPENPDTWSRLKTQHTDFEDDWQNDGFPDDDDDIFASIDTGEGPAILKPVENVQAPNPRTRHDSDSSVSSVRSETRVNRNKPSSSQRSISPESSPSPTQSRRNRNESPASVPSTSSSSIQSTSQRSKKSLDSPQSVRSSASSSVISQKQPRNSKKGRLRAIMEDSDSDDDTTPASRTSKRSSDSELDSDADIGPRLSKTVLSSDDEEPGPSKSSNQRSQGHPGKTSLRRVIDSDSDDDGDPALQITEVIAASGTQGRSRSPSPEASNGSSDISQGSKRKRSTKLSDQTTLLIDGTMRTGRTMSSDQSDASEAESRSGRKSVGKRPRLDSSDDEMPASSPVVTPFRRRRVVSDSDDD